MDDHHLGNICPKCRVPMNFRALQHVDDPRKGGVEIAVFECPVCGRLAAAPEVEVEAEAEPALH